MKFSAFLAMFAMTEASDQSKGETYSVHFTHFEYKVVREKSGHFFVPTFLTMSEFFVFFKSN